MKAIVSAYYQIPSKQSHSWYLPHLIRWFRSIGKLTRVHFFTTADIHQELSRRIPNDSKHITFHIMPMERFQSARIEDGFWERQYSRDPERYHSPELGMIWYEKRHFVIEAMKVDPSDVFFWCDAGCIRDDKTEYFARNFGTRDVCVDDGTMHLQQVDRLKDEEFYQYPTTAIACAIMAGNRRAWIRFVQDYEESLREFDTVNISAISDQYVTARCVRKNTSGYTLHPEQTAISEWFKFLELL